MSPIRILKVAAFLLMIVPVTPALSQTREGQYARPALGEGGYPYQLFVPRGYLASPDSRWPLLMFLHGSGERGEDVARVKVHGPPKVADRNPKFPFITVSPLLPAEQDWDQAKLEAILEHVAGHYRVDRSRIYLTGLSRGGHATWRWAAADPRRFAAIAPVSGRGDTAQACKLEGTPVWAFHGDRDDIVPPVGSFAMVEALRNCGGKPRLTIYADTGHDAWTRAYDDPELYLWLLEHTLPGRGAK